MKPNTLPIHPPAQEQPASEPAFTPQIAEAIYAAWHGAGVDIAKRRAYEALLKFHDFMGDRYEALFDNWGAEAIDLWNASEAAITEERQIAGQSAHKNAPMVSLSMLGAVPAGMEQHPGIAALTRLCNSVCIVDKMACWDHVAMFDLRDIICELAATPPTPAERAEHPPRITQAHLDGLAAVEQELAGIKKRAEDRKALFAESPAQGRTKEQE